MALTPAFIPEQVLEIGADTVTHPNVGYLGEWIPHGCLAVPMAPCDVSVMIGNLTATLGMGSDMGGAMEGEIESTPTAAYPAPSTMSGKTAIATELYPNPYPYSSTMSAESASAIEVYPNPYQYSPSESITATKFYTISTSVDIPLLEGYTTPLVETYPLYTSASAVATSTSYDGTTGYPVTITSMGYECGYGYSGNDGYTNVTSAATSYSGPVADSTHAAFPGAEAPTSLMVGVVAMLLVALF